MIGQNCEPILQPCELQPIAPKLIYCGGAGNTLFRCSVQTSRLFEHLLLSQGEWLKG
jgi:hypothetical protein